jgi:hypothetical protein
MPTKGRCYDFYQFSVALCSLYSSGRPSTIRIASGSLDETAMRP